MSALSVKGHARDVLSLTCMIGCLVHELLMYLFKGTFKAGSTRWSISLLLIAFLSLDIEKNSSL